MNVKFLFVVLGAACAMSIAGCLFAGTGSGEGMCQTSDKCVDWVFSSESWRLDLLRDNCEGTWGSTASCGTTNVVGVCIFNGDYGMSTTHYSADAYTLETAQNACTTEVNGTFTPGSM